MKRTNMIIRLLVGGLIFGGLLLFPMRSAQAEPALTSITVSPADPAISIGQAQQFTATGTFDDGSSRVLGGNSWAMKSPLSKGRGCPGVVALKGIIYVIGGVGLVTGDNLLRVDAYNPRTDTWRPLAPMPEEVGCPGVGVDVKKGIIYVIGFTYFCDTFCTPLSALYAYDPAANTWTKKAPMPTPRSNIAAAVANGILYTFGGVGIPFDPDLVEAYDPVTDTWTTKTPMPLPYPYTASSAGVINGKIYVLAGGGIVIAYDPSTDTWTTKAPMPISGISLGVGIAGGRLYTVGGGPSALTNQDSVVQIYDPAKDDWSVMAPIPAIGPYEAAVSNGTLYALNTGGDPTTVGSLWVFTPPEARWSSGDTSVATVNGSGLAQAKVNVGSTTITASIGPVSGSSLLTTLSQPIYSLRVRNNGYGSVYLYSGATGFDSCGESDCEREFPSGVKVELKGDAYAAYYGYPGVTWLGACAGQGNPCTMTMDSNREVTAIFPFIPY